MLAFGEVDFNYFVSYWDINYVIISLGNYVYSKKQITGQAGFDLTRDKAVKGLKKNDN